MCTNGPLAVDQFRRRPIDVAVRWQSIEFGSPRNGTVNRSDDRCAAADLRRKHEAALRLHFVPIRETATLAFRMDFLQQCFVNRLNLVHSLAAANIDSQLVVSMRF